MSPGARSHCHSMPASGRQIEKGLFGGLCGLTPRRRCQPSSDATRAESVFPTKREGPARRRRHTMVAEALVPPDAARVAIRIATRVATVYTNAPKRHRGAIFGDLCTLLRPHGRSHDPREAQQCTQTPQNGAERPDPPICVHYCDPKATHNPSPRRNSVHKRPKTTRRDHFGQSVYTPASPPGGEAHVASAVTPTPP